MRVFSIAMFFKIIFLVLVSYFLFIPILSAQNSSTETPTESIYDTLYTKRKIKLIRREVKQTNYKKGDIDIYFSPFAFLEPITPTIYLGGEYFIKDKFSIHTDLGYMVNLFGLKLNTEANPAFSAQEEQIDQVILNSSKANYVIKPELRWYKGRCNPKDASYYGIRLMFRNVNYYKNQRTNEEYAYSTLTNNWTGIGDETISIYRVRRRSVGIQFLLGGKNSFLKTFTSNWYMGVGVRYISNLPTNKAFDPFEDFTNVFFTDANLEFLKFNKQYKFVTMDFALGMRFGGKLKR